MHRATVDALVIASDREEAKKKALAKFYGSSEMDSDFTNLPAIAHKVVCLGTAEKTKARKQ